MVKGALGTLTRTLAAELGPRQGARQRARAGLDPDARRRRDHAAGGVRAPRGARFRCAGSDARRTPPRPRSTCSATRLRSSAARSCTSTAASSPRSEERSHDAHRIYAIRYGHLDRTSEQNFLGGDDHARRHAARLLRVGRPRGEARHRRSRHRLRFRRRGAARPHAPAAPWPTASRRLASTPARSRTWSSRTCTTTTPATPALFPRARFHLQDAEMAWCTGRAMTHPHLSAPFAAEDVATFVRRVFEGRVDVPRRRSELCAGRELASPAWPHPGLQAVRVETGRGPVVLASDVAHFWANLERESVRSRSSPTCPRISTPTAASARSRRRSITSSRVTIRRYWRDSRRNQGSPTSFGSTSCRLPERVHEHLGFVGLGRMGGAMARGCSPPGIP